MGLLNNLACELGWIQVQKRAMVLLCPGGNRFETDPVSFLTHNGEMAMKKLIKDILKVAAAFIIGGVTGYFGIMFLAITIPLLATVVIVGAQCLIAFAIGWYGMGLVRDHMVRQTVRKWTTQA